MRSYSSATPGGSAYEAVELRPRRRRPSPQSRHTPGGATTSRPARRCRHPCWPARAWPARSRPAGAAAPRCRARAPHRGSRPPPPAPRPSPRGGCRPALRCRRCRCRPRAPRGSRSAGRPTCSIAARSDARQAADVVGFVAGGYARRRRPTSRPLPQVEPEAVVDVGAGVARRPSPSRGARGPRRRGAGGRRCGRASGPRRACPPARGWATAPSRSCSSSAHLEVVAELAEHHEIERLVGPVSGELADDEARHCRGGRSARVPRRAQWETARGRRAGRSVPRGAG